MIASAFPFESALVTGGSGFIGSYLAERMLDAGVEVWALDNLSTGRRSNVEHLRRRTGFHLVEDSVLSRPVVNELVHRCDVVFHLAAAVGVRLVVEQPVHTLITNVRGTETVLDYCNRFDKRVLITSTSEVYGDHPADVFLREDDRRIYGPTTERRWGYACSKAMDEFFALAFHQERGLDVVVARIFNTVGPRQNGSYGTVVPRFVSWALNGDPLQIHGTGEQTRAFCHVTDTVEALLALMAGGTSGEIYNVGSQERVTILELAERILALTGSDSPLEYIPYDQVFGVGIEDMLHRAPSTDKIRDELGWRTTRDLDAILADTIAFESGGVSGAVVLG